MFRGRHCHPKRNNGFTLVELAIVLVISATLLGSLFALVNNIQERARVTTTLKRMEAIQLALFQFGQTFEYLPCPADPFLRQDDANFGISSLHNPHLNRDPRGTQEADCNRTTTVLARFNNNVVKGMVPVATLQLPPEYALDGWGHRFSYVMDEDLSFRGATGVTVTNVQNNTAGGFITYGDNTNAGNQQNSGGDIRYSANFSNNNDVQSMAAVIISHGKNGFGAYLPRGNGVVPDPVPSSTATELAHAATGNNPAVNFTATGIIGAGNFAAERTFDDIVFPIPRWRILSARHTTANPPPYRQDPITGNNLRW